MFGLNDGMRYYVCQRYVRMNLGINGLYKLVSQEMDLPPLSGAVFIFFSKNRQQVKLLRWDTDGFTLYHATNSSPCASSRRYTMCGRIHSTTSSFLARLLMLLSLTHSMTARS